MKVGCVRSVVQSGLERRSDEVPTIVCDNKFKRAGSQRIPGFVETRAAVEAVEASVKAAGKLLGGLPTPARSAEELYEAGYNLVLADFDAALLRDGARARVAALRAASRNSS